MSLILWNCGQEHIGRRIRIKKEAVPHNEGFLFHSSPGEIRSPSIFMEMKDEIRRKFYENFNRKVEIYKEIENTVEI